MGCQCCKRFTSSSKYLPDSSPSLLSYKKKESLPRNYPRFVSVQLEDNSTKELMFLSVEPINKEAPPDTLQQYPKPSIIENYIIVWLTSDIDKDDNSIHYLQAMFNSLRIFTDIDEFFAFILQVKDNQLFLILSETFAEKIISFIQQTSSLIAIYIMSHDQSKDEQWHNQHRKIKGIFTDIQPVCQQLQCKIHRSEDDIIPNEISNSSTMIIQYLMKRILLDETNHHETSKRDFLVFARQQYPNEVSVITEFEDHYLPSQAIWWYTRKCFLYHAMNRAFSTDNIDLLFKMGFFIRDLHQQINRYYEKIDESNIKIVYRGQGILADALEVIKTNRNGLFTFKNFLWTNTDHRIALKCAQSTRKTPHLCGVLFRIEIAASIPSNSLEKLSYYLDSTNDILLSIYSRFRIGDIEQIDDHIWQIDLKLIHHDDRQLKDYRRTLGELEGDTAWQQLGFYFIQINQLHQAEELYKSLLHSNSLHDPKQLSLLYEQLGFIYHKKNDPSTSLTYYKKSLRNYLTFLSSNDSSLLPIYLNIGILRQQQRNFNEAVKHFKYALNIASHSVPLDHLQIANLHHYIADIYEADGRFVDAIQHYQSALESELHHFPLLHLSIAKTYEKIGDIFYQMDNYTASFSYFDKVLKIQKKTLSPNHPTLAITNYHLARALAGLQQYKEAVEDASRAVNIARHSFGSNHKDVRLYEDYLDELREKTLIGVVPNGAVYE